MKNHISISDNLYWIKIQNDLEIKSENWSYGLKSTNSQPLRVKAKVRAYVATLIKSKRNKVAIINTVKLKLKKYILYLFLSLVILLYQEGYYMDCQQSPNAQQKPKTQLKWVKHNGHTHSTSLRTRENWIIRFPKPEGSVWADSTNGWFSNSKCYDFQNRMFWFLLASFWGTSIKAFPSLLWRVLVPPMKILIPKPLWALTNTSWWCFVWFMRNPSLGRENPLCEHLSFVKQLFVAFVTLRGEAS
jgi:hypothetical protein